MAAKPSVKKQNADIKVEVERFNILLPLISEKKQATASMLIEKIAFMAITLKILEENIKLNGPITRMINGKQDMMIINPAQKSYDSLITRYMNAIEKLNNMLPPSLDLAAAINNGDDFDSFVQERGD